MSTERVKKRARRSKRRTTAAAAPASLPPLGTGPDAPTSLVAIDPLPDATPTPPKPKKPFWDVGKGSKAYEQCMKVLAMRTAGIDDKDIAEALDIKPQSVWNYAYMAGKNGWATTFANAKDQIEFAIMPKVLREIEEGLGDKTRHSTSGMEVSKQIALRMAEITMAKSFGHEGAQAAPTNVIAIRIEMPPGQQAVIREGSIAGVGAYIEGEAADVGERGNTGGG